ncbi:putative transmembrane protein 244 isoform X2 [Hyperolius riggenbachi]|uniref:putative transmembrane protein 244 isoform X2 n=1 Tax=Hyperolius riggenbachi TaxID=752182 RepID=UPI0035A34774
MALKIQVAETKVVLQNLFLCTVVFYTVYYLAYTISFLALRLDSFDEFGPFDFKTAPSWASKKYLVNVISLEATFVISSALFVLVVEEWIWDYACTVTMIHIAATSLGFGLIAMIVGGQMLAYLLYKDNFIYPDLEHF